MEETATKKRRVYKNTKNMGRPKLSKDNKQKHQRIALYPETYEIFKRLSDKEGGYMIEYFDRLAKKLDK